MKERASKVFNKIESNKLTDLVFLILIGLMAFCKVNKGLDITDSAYSCTNFNSLDILDGMWYYSTFYANLVGGLLTHLPMGDTFLGLNIYTHIFMYGMAVIAYFFFTRTVKTLKVTAFAGVLVSVALCWCPTTILYNYLTYLLFLVGTVLLYKGIVNNKTKQLVLAGFALGCNFFVRLPNVIEVGLILALWIYCILTKTKFKECLHKTLWCVLGYVIAFIPGIVLIGVTRGFKAYFEGISELFNMTGESTSYSSVSMIISIVKQYIETLRYTWIAVIMLIVAALIFKFLPKTVEWLKYILTFIVSVCFIYVLYKKGMFPLNFHWFEPVYRYGALIFTFAIVTFVLVIFSNRRNDKEKLVSLLALLQLFITPIGSNNDIYSNLNNLFFVLPAFLWFIVKFAGEAEWIKGVRFSTAVLACVWFALSVKFGFSYIFRDGTVDPMDTYVYNNPRMAGMKTTASNAQMLTELSDVWDELNLSEGEVLLYGDVCGLGFYMDTPLAISTAWPSLASFSQDKFSKELDTLADKIESGEKKAPTVVLSISELHKVYSADRSGKQEILNEFIGKYNYNVAYINDVLAVLVEY